MKRFRALGAAALLLIVAAVAFAQEQQRLYNIIVLTRLDFASGVLTSARLRTGLSDETGSGSAVFGTSPTLNTPIIASETVTAAGGTETLTSDDCGQTTLLDTDTGSVVTLPAATGSGCVLRFFVTDGNGSNAHQINVVGNDEFVGGLISIGTTADQADAFTAAEAGDTDRISMNGSTTGGLEGTWILLQDVSADNWAVSGIVVSTDASATMLATGQVS